MKPLSKHQNAGFTIIELIVVLVMASVLAAIAAPSWLAFLNRQRLNTAQSEVVTAMREAQAGAKRQKRNWEVCFQDKNDKIRWTVRPSPKDPNAALDCTSETGTWKDLGGSDANKIRLETANTNTGVRFQQNGWLDLQIHSQPDPTKDVVNKDGTTTKVTLMIRNQTGGSKRCVYAATLLGAIRNASDNECK